MLLLIILSSWVRAHQIDEITLRLETTDYGWTAIIQADAAYMLPEYRGDAEISPFDLAWLRTRSPKEWERIREEAEIYFNACLDFGTSEISYSFPDFDSDPPLFMTEGIAEMPPMMEVVISGPNEDSWLPITWNEPFGVVLIVDHEGQVIPLVSGESEKFSTPVTAEYRKPLQLYRWIHLGFIHIIPDGLDHILFILAIFLLKPKWKPLLIQSSIFTLTHTLTLGAAMLGLLSIPSSIIEPLIALSIAWVAFENLQRKEPNTRRYLIIGCFGLVHGLGFAGSLIEALPDGTNATIPLFGIFVGIEFGQIAVLAVAGSMTGWWMDHNFAKLRISGSILIGLTGFIWFIQRVFS